MKNLSEKIIELKKILDSNKNNEKIEKIGEVNIKELRKTAKYDPVRPMRSIFTELLKGTPEVKGAELLTC